MVSQIIPANHPAQAERLHCWGITVLYIM